MKRISLILAIALAGGVAQADTISHSAWRAVSDDTVSCMAIGCQEGDFQRYPEYAPRYGSDTGYTETQSRAPYPHREVIEESVPFDPSAEILRRLKDEEPVARIEPRPIPENESAARAAFYRALGQHADGAGTIEQAEAAYEHLLPYRR